MRVLAKVAVALLVTSGFVGLGSGVAYAATPNCINSQGWRLTYASDGDPIDVGLPAGGAGANGTVCLLARQTYYNSGVTDLQQALNRCYGYGIAIDGVFGTGTYNALRDFQSKHGLSVDGIYGPNTARAIHWDSYYGETSRYHTPSTEAGCRSAAALIQ